MTDQIYYKIQYPLKKAINLIKRVDPADPFAGISKDQLSEEDLEELSQFLEMWREEGKIKLERVIKNLKKIQ